MRLLTFFILIFTLAACSSTPVPAWKNSAFIQLENYKKNALEGNKHFADIHFQKAISHIKKSGRIDLIEKAWLIRCSVEKALLLSPDCSNALEFQDLTDNQENKNYYQFLTMPVSALSEDRIPEQYKDVILQIKTGSIPNEDLKNISNPLSRLIIFTKLLETNQYNETTLHLIIETASQQGWKRVVVRSMEKLVTYYRSQHMNNKALNLQDKLKILKKD